MVHKNIRALLEVHRRQEKEKSLAVRISETVTRFAGSLGFVWLHAALLAFWLMANTKLLPMVRPWDPYPFVMLAMTASVEAIFLSTFVLISQNRMAELDQERAELDLQMNLLAELEVTRLLQMMEKVVEKLNIPNTWDDLAELKREVAPDEVLAAIERESEQE
ncbi:MAG TPA: DUF1003 domain-containing protein [Fimbriimonas sp.]